MLTTCPKCKSQQVKDKTANVYFVIAIVLTIVSAVLVFFAWGWAFLTITAMLVSVLFAILLPSRKYQCKECGNEWKDEYDPSGKPSPIVYK